VRRDGVRVFLDYNVRNIRGIGGVRRLCWHTQEQSQARDLYSVQGTDAVGMPQANGVGGRIVSAICTVILYIGAALAGAMILKQILLGIYNCLKLDIENKRKRGYVFDEMELEYARMLVEGPKKDKKDYDEEYDGEWSFL